MNRKTCAIAMTLLAACCAIPAQSRELPVQTYRGVVTGAGGPHAAAFRIGEPVQLAYAVDRSATDSASDPNDGVYFNGLRRLAIALPESRAQVVMGPGSAFVYNDADGPSDQVFFLTYDVVRGATLQGQPIVGLEVDFIDHARDGSASMIDSDALPLRPLLADETCAMFATSAGWTTACFAVEPVD